MAETLRHPQGIVEIDEASNGRRVLDFGCGAGASTMCLARLFPDVAIVGIEVDERLLGLARRRVQNYQFPNVTLACSPSPMELPPDLGRFDGVVMSAVYEHLLTHERAQVLPLLWSVIIGSRWPLRARARSGFDAGSRGRISYATASVERRKGKSCACCLATAVTAQSFWSRAGMVCTIGSICGTRR